MLDEHRTTPIVGQLDPVDAVCTFAEAISRPDITGNFGDFLYCAQNGQQVLLGHSGPELLGTGGSATASHSVFMSKDDGSWHRSPVTWEELRDLLSQGWVLGTDRRPGIKTWYPHNGRNWRLTPEDVYVFRPKGA